MEGKKLKLVQYCSGNKKPKSTTCPPTVSLPVYLPFVTMQSEAAIKSSMLVTNPWTDTFT